MLARFILAGIGGAALTLIVGGSLYYDGLKAKNATIETQSNEIHKLEARNSHITVAAKAVIAADSELLTAIKE